MSDEADIRMYSGELTDTDVSFLYHGHIVRTVPDCERYGFLISCN
jgi:hypothetical protein